MNEDLFQQKNKDLNNQNNCDDNTTADVVIEKTSSAASSASTNEEFEQIGKSIAVGRMEVEYEDDRNVIHAIINAISVRINMPRGTVKVLMACLVAILLAVIVFAFNKPDTDNSTTKNVETPSAEASRDYAQEGKAVNKERPANIGDYVIISSHYRYQLPEDVLGVWEPEDYYAENETFCEFNYSDNEYTIRSYLLDYYDAELSDIVKADLSQFDNMKFLEEQYIECDFGDVLMIKFEATDEDGQYTAGTGYYWYESDPKICCIEISSDDWHKDGTEEKILDSVYRISSESNVVPPDAEEIWQEQQKEDAMNSLVEDAMNDYYEPEPDYDPLF